MSFTAIASVLLIREDDIDHAAARGADDDGSGPRIVNIPQLFRDARLAIFALCAVLFHFANAAVLPLVAEFVAQGQNVKAAPLVMSSCITVTQLTIIPIGLMIGCFAQKFPRKPVYLIAFCALPVRCMLYTLSDNPIWLVAVQILDGVGAGVFGIMQTLVVADLTKATGRFNLAQGAIAMAVGIGASSSNLLGGNVVQWAGYRAGFVTLAAIAAIALLVFWFAMPETKVSMQPARSADRKRAVALISNLMNNLPVGLIGANALRVAHIPASMKNAFLIGVDLGPNLSVTGSLATILLLLALRREGSHVTAWTFLKIGVLVMPLALIAAVVALMLCSSAH